MVRRRSPLAHIRDTDHPSRMSRADLLHTQTRHFIAKVRVFDTVDGGRKGPAYPGWGCPCMVSTAEPLIGYDELPFLDEGNLLPGEIRRLGFYLLSYQKAVPLMRNAGRFYLWDGGFIGEAMVINRWPLSYLQMQKS